MPRPIVSTSSPPESHSHGSDNSQTCAQVTPRSAPPVPAWMRVPRWGSSVSWRIVRATGRFVPSYEQRPELCGSAALRARSRPRRIVAMRIVVLGGAGETGAALSADLAAQSEVDELVVADLDRERAEALVARLPGGKAVAARVDVRDPDAALPLLEGADLLMNCLSFTLFGPALELAIRAGVNYADLISEPDPEQRRSAAAAGITAVSGLGATPGLSNVLVRDAAARLDELREAHISWVSFRTIAPSPGLLDTILWELADDCPTRLSFQDGRYERAGFMEGSKLVDFAEPVGRQRVYFVPHPEVVTLPRHFPSLRVCAVRGSYRPELMEHARVMNAYGLLDEGAREATKARIWESCGGQRDTAAWLLFVHVDAIGRRDGGAVRIAYDVSHPSTWAQEGTGRMTGACAAVGAQLLSRHGRAAAGFVDPEAYFDPSEFLAELERRGTVTVTRSETPI